MWISGREEDRCIRLKGVEPGFCFWGKTKASKRKINKGKKAAVHQSRAKFSPALRKKREKRRKREKKEERKKQKRKEKERERGKEEESKRER